MPLLPLRLRLVSGPRLLIGLLATAAVLLAFGLFTSDARATDSPTETLELHPGDNFVGWVAEPILIDDLFDQIPASKLVYTWAADSRSWRYAISEVGGNLKTLDPGMAAMIKISGSEPVEWERPLTPAKGMVTLYSGVNWVAWNGRDEWPLDQVARGIGTSLVSIEVEERGIVYQPNDNISVAIEPLSGQSTLRRGDALRVTVNRDLRWLQPTGMMPEVVWIGDFSLPLKERISSDILRVIDYFASTYGVETDFANTRLTLWNDLNAAVEYYVSNFQYYSNRDTLRRSLINNPILGGGGGVTMSICDGSSWCGGQLDDSLNVPVFAHELFHTLQFQLSYNDSARPFWMIEGSAEWSGYGLAVADGSISFQASRSFPLDAARSPHVTLPMVDWQRNKNYEYSLGLLAVDRLVELSSFDSIVEYFRQSYPQSLGADDLPAYRIPQQDTFASVFGLTLTNFYSEFEKWHRTWRNPLPEEWDKAVLLGRLTYDSDLPATDFVVEALHYKNGKWVEGSIVYSARVEDDGSFMLRVPPNISQRIQVARGDACRLYLSRDGLRTDIPSANEVRYVSVAKPTRLNLELPHGACMGGLTVTVVRDEASDYCNEYFAVLLVAESGNGHGVQQSCGQPFTHWATAGSRYQVRVDLGDAAGGGAGCYAWVGDHGLIVSQSDSRWFPLGVELIGLQVSIPKDLCAWRLQGRVLDRGGNPRGQVLVAVSGGSESLDSMMTDSDGHFGFLVPTNGEYWLYAWQDGCNVFRRQAGDSTLAPSTSDKITIAGADVTGIEWVYENLCE